MDERLKLIDPDVQTRQEAAESLSYLGADAAPAAVELVRACDDDESVSQWAVAALEEMGRPPTDTLGELTQIAESGESLATYWAVTLLGRAGDAAHDSESVLARLAGHCPDQAIRERAVWALGKIHACSPESIAALQSASNSDSPRLVQLASEALAQVST